MVFTGFMKSILALVIAIVVVNQSIFFSTMGLLGVDYEGSDSSSVYVIYLISLFMFVLVSYLLTFIKVGVLRGEGMVLSIISFFIATHFLWVIFDSSKTELLPMFMIHSFVLGFSGLLAAAVMVKLKVVGEVVKVLEVLFVIQAIGILIYSVLSTLSGAKVASLAGANYQTLSYFSSFTMGMLLVYGFILPSGLRFSFARNLVYKVFLYSLIIGCAVGVLVGGGRGAFILMLLYLAFGVYNLSKFGGKASAKKVIMQMTRLLVLCSGVVVFLTLFSDKEFIQQGFDRATQFISSDGSIDLHRGSSGRDRVYVDSLDYIMEQPILGYGPFGVRDKSIHAHNFFLEVWLQFGIFAIFALPLIFFALFKKMKILGRPFRVWGWFLALYPLILIQFSGSYLAQPSLWFFIGMVVLSANKDRFQASA